MGTEESYWRLVEHNMECAVDSLSSRHAKTSPNACARRRSVGRQKLPSRRPEQRAKAPPSPSLRTGKRGPAHFPLHCTFAAFRASCPPAVNRGWRKHDTYSKAYLTCFARDPGTDELCMTSSRRCSGPQTTSGTHDAPTTSKVPRRYTGHRRQSPC